MIVPAIALSAMALSLLVACGAPARPPEGPAPEPLSPPPTTSEARLEFAHRIDDPETWARLAARPATSTVARPEVVKFLIDLERDRQPWFIDTARWDVHYFFARERLPGVENSNAAWGRFNVEQYRRDDRRFVLGSLVHYLDSDIWALEMIAGDTLSADRLVALHEQLRGLVYFGDQLRYRPVSELHDERLREAGARLPSVTSDEVFAGVLYQPLTQGVAYGTLRFVRGALDSSTVRPNQILVLEQLPDAIPVSSGVISAQLQAPLGHLALLCATRQTPNMGLRDALNDPRLAPLEGRIVRLEVGPQELLISEATMEEAERAWASSRPSAVQTPPLDRTDRGLPDVCTLSSADANTVGAKAAQLGEVCQLGGNVVTPGGFAVSFHHYLAHLERSGAAQGLGAMLSDPAFQADATVRDQNLGQLRTVIERARVDPALLRAVRQKIAAFSGSPRVILRSSTNAEDLPGFTGAGLYRSIVIAPNASDAELGDAIRRVWSSVWLDGAYEERAWYRIDHATVAMGVLIQPFVDGAVANGVALTQNPFYRNRPGYYVNAQALGGSVTGAGGDEIPEQWLIYTYSEDLESELLSRSSRGGGAALLRDAEIRELAAVLARLKAHFEPRWEGRANAVDVEFLIAGPDRDVIVLQARPFMVRYHDTATDR